MLPRGVYYGKTMQIILSKHGQKGQKSCSSSQDLVNELDQLGKSCCGMTKSCSSKAACVGVDHFNNTVEYVNLDICTR